MNEFNEYYVPICVNVCWCVADGCICVKLNTHRRRPKFELIRVHGKLVFRFIELERWPITNTQEAAFDCVCAYGINCLYTVNVTIKVGRKMWRKKYRKPYRYQNGCLNIWNWGICPDKHWLFQRKMTEKYRIWGQTSGKLSDVKGL